MIEGVESSHTAVLLLCQPVVERAAGPAWRFSAAALLAKFVVRGLILC